MATQLLRSREGLQRGQSDSRAHVLSMTLFSSHSNGAAVSRGMSCFSGTSRQAPARFQVSLQLISGSGIGCSRSLHPQLLLIPIHGTCSNIPRWDQLAQPRDLEAEAGLARPVEAEAGYGGGVGAETPRPGVCHSPDAALPLRTSTNSSCLLFTR